MELNEIYNLYLKSSGASTDTRSLRQGEIFFALKGPNFDGNTMALTAIETGAMFAIVDDPNVVVDDRFILVPSVLETMQLLAREHRSNMNYPVLGITGSNGKTTTKELVKLVLNKKFIVACTKGNYNNHIGLPLTILNAERDATFLILEMGTNEPGNIEELCQIGSPTLGLITNIGLAHIEKLGSQEGVYYEKAKLFNSVEGNSGTIFLNEDDQWLRDYDPFEPDKTIRFDATQVGSFEVSLVDREGFGLRIRLRNKQTDHFINSHLSGTYNLPNILAACCIGLYFDIPIAEIAQAIESYQPDNMRSQLKVTKRNRLIVDAYNANPTSMKASIEAVVEQQESDVVLIIGDMLELGEDAILYHQEILNLPCLTEVEEVILVGDLFAQTKGHEYLGFQTVDKLIDSNLLQSLKDKLILIKGSRGMRLEKTIASL